MTLLRETLPPDPLPPLREPPPRMRASDADREAVVRTLLDALARGLLTLDEGDERVAAAYAARYQDELPRLTADLPPAPAAASAPVAPGWRALALLAWLQVRTALIRLWRATRRVVRARPRLVVGVLAVLALLFLIAGTARGAGAGEGYGGHGSYGWDGGHGWHDHHHGDD
jgi:phytoene dehydrogenase-like protein